MTGPARTSFWGKGLVAAFALFIAVILVMVAIAMSERVDLVTDTYYDQGLRYQERIDAARSGSGEEGMTVDMQDGAIVLRFARRYPEDPIEGSVTLYRPADKSRDMTVPVVVDAEGVQRIPAVALDRGLWRVKAAWTVRGEARYHEEPLVLQ
jgi:hypothetical protein